MFTFLKKIRKAGIENSRTRQYLFYAVGEVVLVVVGILIALQINNWNEWRKDRHQERVLLEGLYDNLNLNKALLEERLTLYQRFNQSSQYVLSFVSGELLYSDTLDLHFHQARLRLTDSHLSKSGFESLKNAGFDLITNGDLQKEVINLFENVYLDMQAFLSALSFHYDPDWQTFTAQHFSLKDSKDGPGMLTPHDLRSLRSSSYYQHQITEVLGYREHTMSMQERCLEETQRVLELIRRELDNIRTN